MKLKAMQRHRARRARELSFMIPTRLPATVAGAAIALAAWVFLAPSTALPGYAQAAAVSASASATTASDGDRRGARGRDAATGRVGDRSGSSQRRAAHCRGSGLDGVGRGAQTRKYSRRGAASRSAMQRAGYGNAVANVDQ
jgi:hypothetical protein